MTKFRLNPISYNLLPKPGHMVANENEYSKDGLKSQSVTMVHQSFLFENDKSSYNVN